MKVFLENKCAKTRHVGTHLNQFFTLIMNLVMNFTISEIFKIQNFWYIFVNVCPPHIQLHEG